MEFIEEVVKEEEVLILQGEAVEIREKLCGSRSR